MNPFTKKQIEILQLIMNESERVEKAIFTEESKRTPYQNELLNLWDKLHNIVKSNN